MMEHYTDLLIPYLDGELPAEEAAKVEAHLSQCAHCRAEHAALLSVEHLLSAAPMVAPPAHFVTRFEARLERRLHRRRAWLGATVIGLALALATGLLVWSAAGSGLALWGALATSPLPARFVAALPAVLNSLSLVLKIGVLAAEALTQAVRHPVFWGWMFVSAGVISLWVQLVRRWMLAPQPAGG